MESVIFTRVKELCAENNITISRLESELGVGQYTIARWKNTTCPTIDKISKVANYFNVSIDYLVGASDVRSTSGYILSDPDSISIQRAMERMTDQDKDRMMGVLKAGFDYAFVDKKDDPKQ
jgi:transcriptional regulator with XRE-family HTH domain